MIALNCVGRNLTSEEHQAFVKSISERENCILCPDDFLIVNYHESEKDLLDMSTNTLSECYSVLKWDQVIDDLAKAALNYEEILFGSPTAAFAFQVGMSLKTLMLNEQMDSGSLVCWFLSFDETKKFTGWVG